MVEDHPRMRMLREQSKNFYVPNIYHFDTSTYSANYFAIYMEGVLHNFYDAYCLCLV